MLIFQKIAILEYQLKQVPDHIDCLMNQNAWVAGHGIRTREDEMNEMTMNHNDLASWILGRSDCLFPKKEGAVDINTRDFLRLGIGSAPQVFCIESAPATSPIPSHIEQIACIKIGSIIYYDRIGPILHRCNHDLPKLPNEHAVPATATTSRDMVSISISTSAPATTGSQSIPILQ